MSLTHVFPTLLALTDRTIYHTHTHNNNINIHRFHVTSQGAPTETHKRSSLKLLCFLKWIPFSLFRAACVILGAATVLSFQSVCECYWMTTTTMDDDDTTKDSQNRQGKQRNQDKKCPNYTNSYVLLCILFLLHLMDSCTAALTYVYFLSVWQRRRRRQRHGLLSRFVLTCNITWATCCRLACTCVSVLTCCVFGGARAIVADFSDVSTGLEALMENANVDVTVSDVIAALVVLRLVQARARTEYFLRAAKSRNEQIITETKLDDVSKQTVLPTDKENMTTKPSTSQQKNNPQRLSILQVHRRENGGCLHHAQEDIYCEEFEREVLSPQNKEDRTFIADGAHYMRLAHAVYGHLMYFYDHPLSGPCCATIDRIRCRRASTTSFMMLGKKKEYPHIVGDNMCGCNEIGMLRVAELDPDVQELLYASFRADVRRTPYAVVIDHVKLSVVVVIRGTLSLEDAVADLKIRPSRLPEEFGYDNTYCHSGMLGCCEWIYEDLKRIDILSKLLSGQYSDYNLVITGHSLGAGCAAILSLMFLKDFPDLKCYAFEPPGSVLSENVADIEHITSYVLNTDIVPRLSYLSIRNLRDDVLDMIARIRVPKHKILRLSFADSTDELLSALESEIIHSTESLPESDFSILVQGIKDSQSGRVPSGYEDVDLFPPGRIIHLIPRYNASSLYSDESCSDYVAVWAQRDDLMDIQITKTLVSDHIPTKNRVELETLNDFFQSQCTSYTSRDNVITSQSIYHGEMK